MSGYIENYRGYDIEGLKPVVLKIYNDTGSAVTAGDGFHLSFAKDADSLSPSARPTLDAWATTSIPRQVVVALEDVADQAYGEFMLRGYCPKVACAATIAAEDYLQAADGVEIAADDGTSQTVDSFGIALTAYSAGFCTAYLFGETCIIG